MIISGKILMKKIKFQFYANDISKPEPVGWVSLLQFIESIKNPKPEIQELFQNIEKAAASGDLKLKDKLKSKLFYFTPCVQMDGVGRGYSNIKSFTELLVLDFDKIENAPAFKDFLFEAMPQIVCAYLSPSRKGVKFIVRIPKCEGVEDFKSYFYGIAYHLEKYRGFDPTTQNCVLPLYLSWDTEIRTRPFEQTAVWTRRGMKLQECKKRDPREPIIEAENIDEDSRKGIRRIISSMMGSIVDAGHPVVRSSALLLGGYVGSGYFSQDEAEDIMDSLINESAYCKKNPNGYKKTAQQMIVRGMSSPLYYEND